MTKELTPDQKQRVAEWVQRGKRMRRLDSATSRMAGLARHALRPLRRVVVAIYRRL